MKTKILRAPMSMLLAHSRLLFCRIQSRYMTTMASVTCCHTQLAPSSRLTLQRTCELAPFKSQSRRRTIQQRQCVTKAELDSQALLAVTQQGLLFAAVAGGETWLSRQALAPGTAGRPDIVPTAIGVGAIIAAIAITQIGGVAQQAGLVAGVGTTIALLINYGKRFVDTPDDPSDWPGPKVWPFTMVLLDFFAVNIFGQALARTL